MFFIRNYFKAFMLLGFLVSAYGQDSSEIAYYNYFDQKIGVENTGLYQGVVYAEKYRTINELTQFFKTRDFLPGSVCYDGQCYYDLDLRYDVFEDQVLLKLISKAGGGTLKLFKDKIGSFEIDGHQFIRLDQKDATGLNAYGFYEIAYDGPRFTLYSKPTKKNFQRKDRRSLYYEFPDGPTEHVLLYNGNYHIVNSKKEQVQVFPDLKKDIDKFYNLARRLRKSDPNGFHVGLMKRIELLLTQPNNTSK
ncbi:hypothetical protein [Flagellimonas flava]|uniref:GLPGLI family protein n=1 Tax=Flagellimonas flava TaxID=570519 RepID=A0A1M5IFJ8_9FLAO|nr:hypothetical protein [Allomuricauda flava]SHG26869.1 hypothetical protein SAMN04488116_0662 [Allomuricauda flava]